MTITSIPKYKAMEHKIYALVDAQGKLEPYMNVPVDFAPKVGDQIHIGVLISGEFFEKNRIDFCKNLIGKTLNVVGAKTETFEVNGVKHTKVYPIMEIVE